MENMNQRKYRKKSAVRVEVSLALLAISFTIFTFIATLNPNLLKENLFIALQLTLAIPLIITSIFVRSKLTYTRKTKLFANYGFYTFILSYTLLINSIGLMLNVVISFHAALVFFLANIVGAIIYSYLDITENKGKLSQRLKKDWIFILGVILLGILPSLLNW